MYGINIFISGVHQSDLYLLMYFSGYDFLYVCV